MTGETGPARRDRRPLRPRTAPGWWSTRRTGSGVLGDRGRGAAEQTGVLDRVDAVTVAFSKSLASVGGAVMTSRAAADGIRASALPYVFSAANDPASVGAALAALRILRSEPERMARHPENGALLRRALAEAGAPPLPGGARSSPSRPARRRSPRPPGGSPSTPASTCNAVAYPAVPRGRGVLRLSVMATHTAEQLRRAARDRRRRRAQARPRRRPRAATAAVA